MTAIATPDWLVQTEVGLCPCGCVGTRSKGGFVEKTVGGGARVVQHAMFSDDIARKTGLLQALDPRVKLATLFSFLVAASLVRNIAVLVAMYVAALILAMASGLTLRYFVTRVWCFIPIFTAIVVVPAMLNFVTPGQIVVPLGTWFGHSAGLTSQGLTSAALLVSRVAVSISLVVLLTVTTTWNRLLAALRSLFVPSIFVAVLGMTYRYVFHLLNGVTDMYTARKARTVTHDADVAKGRAFVAATGGALFGKAHALSEEVHQAMVARGYTGRHRAMHAARVRAVDLLWILACTGCAIAVIGVDRGLGG